MPLRASSRKPGFILVIEITPRSSPLCSIVFSSLGSSDNLQDQPRRQGCDGLPLVPSFGALALLSSATGSWHSL